MTEKKEELGIFDKFLMGVVALFFLYGFFTHPGLFINPKKGFLPWFYKDTWGGGWKLFAFRVFYVGCELAVIYGVFYALFRKNLYSWVWGLLIVVLFSGTYEKDEDEK